MLRERVPGRPFSPQPTLHSPQTQFQKHPTANLRPPRLPHLHSLSWFYLQCASWFSTTEPPKCVPRNANIKESQSMQGLHAQRSDPLKHCVQDVHQQIYSVGREASHGSLLSGDSVWYWLSTKFDLLIRPPIPPNLHVHSWGILLSENLDLRRGGQRNPLN